MLPQTSLRCFLTASMLVDAALEKKDGPAEEVGAIVLHTQNHVRQSAAKVMFLVLRLTQIATILTLEAVALVSIYVLSQDQRATLHTVPKMILSMASGVGVRLPCAEKHAQVCHNQAPLSPLQRQLLQKLAAPLQVPQLFLRFQALQCQQVFLQK